MVLIVRLVDASVRIHVICHKPRVQKRVNKKKAATQLVFFWVCFILPSLSFQKSQLNNYKVQLLSR